MIYPSPALTLTLTPTLTLTLLTLEVWVAADMVAGKKRAPFRTNRI